MIVVIITIIIIISLTLTAIVTTKYKQSVLAKSPRGLKLHVVGMLWFMSDVNQPSSPTPFLFCPCVCFFLYSPFNCISFHNFSRQLSAFSLFSSGLISTFLALSAFRVVAFSSFAMILGECSTIHSSPALFFFFFFFFEVEISLRTLIPLFTPGSVHSGSASCQLHISL